MTSFEEFTRRARWLDRVTAVIDTFGIAKPIAELVPGRAGTIVRMVTSFDSRFARLLFRFGTNGWHSFESTWVRSMAIDQRSYDFGHETWVVADYGGVPVVWRPEWARGWSWCPLQLPELIAHNREDGPATIAIGENHEIMLHRDLDPVPEKLSEVAADAVAKTRVTAGCRSWLFVGPPGSGKTTIARQLAREIGDGSWITLGPGAASKAEAWQLVHALEPAALVIDDLDASTSERMDIALREGLVAARRYAKVICGTANTVDAVRGSLIRPGRFDEGPVVVSALEPEVATQIGYGLPPAVLDQAREAGLLGAYLHELNLRVLAGRDPAIELPDLVARMAAAGDR